VSRCLVIGKTNVGTSAVVLGFASYMGVESVQVISEDPQGRRLQRAYAVDAAVRDLSGSSPHQTRCLQSITLQLPAGKGFRELEMVDTCGLIEGIHADAQVRRAMAQTLANVRQAQIILHIVDAANAAVTGAVEAFGEVDYQVAQCAQMRGGYLILANKMDLPGAAAGLALIKREFAGHIILPISALYGQGFPEVKRYVVRWL